MAVLKAIREALTRFPETPLLDPVKDMKIGDSEFKEIVKKIKTFEKRLEKHPLHGRPDLPRLLEAYRVRIGCLHLCVYQFENVWKAAGEASRSRKSRCRISCSTQTLFE
jgi:ATP-dependent RNA helicase DOB1